jgi:hypothetical protein
MGVARFVAALGMMGSVAAGCLPTVEFTDGGEASDATVLDDGEGQGYGARTPGDGGTEANLGDGAVHDVAPADGPQDGSAATDAHPTSVSLQDCVLLMHMEETNWSDSGAVTDQSGQRNNGTPWGTAQTTPDGKFGRAALFDGAGYIIVPSSPSLQPTTAYTLSAWVYPTGLVTVDMPYPGIIAKRIDEFTSVAFTMFIWTQNNMWGDVYGFRFNSEAGLTNSQWYHLAIVYDGTLAEPNRVRLYINGTFDNGATNNGNFAGPALGPSDADLTVGYLPEGPSFDRNAAFVGKLDEVAIWTRALQDWEIRLLATATGPL